MANRNYKGLFQDWEIGVAVNVIERVKKEKKCLEHEDFDDLLQECLTHWHFSKDDYDPSLGANIRTFMAKVVEHKLRHIAERLTSNKRRTFIKSVSLDELISDEENSPSFLDRLSVDSQRSTDIKFDIAGAIKRLTPKQRELCRLLCVDGLNINEASKILKTPRGTLYEDIKRIRAVFRQKRFHEYIE